MLVKTILNRVQKFKSFVYGAVRFVEGRGAPALGRRGLRRQGQTHYQKGLQFSDLSSAGSRVISRTWRPTRAKVHPQIFLRRHSS